MKLLSPVLIHLSPVPYIRFLPPSVYSVPFCHLSRSTVLPVYCALQAKEKAMTIDSCHGLMVRLVSGAVFCRVYLVLRLVPGVPSYKRKKA